MHIFSSLFTSIGKVSVYTSELMEEWWRNKRQERSQGYDLISDTHYEY